MHCRRQFRLGPIWIQKILFAKPKGYNVQRIWAPFWRQPATWILAYSAQAKPASTMAKRHGANVPRSPRISILLPSKRRLLLGMIPKRVEFEQKNVAKVKCVKLSSPNWWCFFKEKLADTLWNQQAWTPKHIIDGWIKCTRQPTTSF